MFDGSVLKENKDVRANCVKFLTIAINSNNPPEYLSQFRLSLLSKTNCPETTIDDTRPIAIGSHLLKIIEKAIKLKIEELNSKLF